MDVLREIGTAYKEQHSVRCAYDTALACNYPHTDRFELVESEGIVTCPLTEYEMKLLQMFSYPLPSQTSNLFLDVRKILSTSPHVPSLLNFAVVIDPDSTRSEPEFSR